MTKRWDSTVERAIPAENGKNRYREYLLVILIILHHLIQYSAESAQGITFDDSPALAVAAMDNGIAHPPGYPLWTFLAGTFASILPFGSVATRLIAFSSLCMAATCGMCSWLILRLCSLPIPANDVPSGGVRGARTRSIVAAIAGGLALGHSKAFSHEAGRISVHSLTILLLSLALCFSVAGLTRSRRGWMASFAALLFGLAVGNDHRTIVVLPVLHLVWVAVDLKIGRDLLLLSATITGLLLLAASMDNVISSEMLRKSSSSMKLWGLASLSAALILTFMTRGIGTHVLGSIAAGLSFLASFIPFALLPVKSFANPPMDWGFTRTWTGFLLHVTRAQYATTPTSVDIPDIGSNVLNSLRDLGPLSVFAPLPVLLLAWMTPSFRRPVLAFGIGAFLLPILQTIFWRPVTSEKSWLDISTLFLPTLLLYSVSLGMGLFTATSCLFNDANSIAKQPSMKGGHVLEPNSKVQV